jgi:serine/threonine-protein kinase
MSNSGGDFSVTDEGEPVATLAAGARLGKYEIRRLLGAGGMGAVYEAHHTEIGKRVAIKVLSPELAAVPGARTRFLREAQLTSKLTHPNIVDVNDMGSEDGRAFIVMEFLDGEDLSHRLEQMGTLTVEHLVDIMLPVCSAVAEAHRVGITHRDLKPQNIFLAIGPRGVEPKVLDFGISKGNDTKAGALTGTGMIGTPFYFAPEQILDARAAGPASDQYALGVILYECLTGRRPYEAENLFVVFQSIVEGNAPPIGALRPDLPPSLQQIVARAMNKAPTARFDSAAGLARALLPFASSRVRSFWEHAFATAGPALHAPTMVAQPSGVTPAPRAYPATTPMPHTPRPSATPLPGGTRPLPSPSTGGGRVALASGTTDVDLRPRRRMGPILAAGGLAVAGIVAAVVLTGSGRTGQKTGEITPPPAAPVAIEPVPELPPRVVSPRAVEAPPGTARQPEVQPEPPRDRSPEPMKVPARTFEKAPAAAHRRVPARAHHDHAPGEAPQMLNPNAAPILE